MSNLAVLSLKNRALIALITIVAAIFGGLALTNLTQELIPSIEFPALIVVSTYPGRAKTRNAERDPRVTVCVLSDDFGGAWVQVDGTAEVLDLPEALEPLVDYFRCISGEHPNWDEYRQAMRDQGKSLIRITIDRWGPVATGGFPPDRAPN